MPAELHDLITRKNIGAAKGLLKSLVPRAQCFCFYGLSRDCIWSSDGADDYEIDKQCTDVAHQNRRAISMGLCMFGGTVKS